MLAVKIHNNTVSCSSEANNTLMKVTKQNSVNHVDDATLKLSSDDGLLS